MYSFIKGGVLRLGDLAHAAPKEVRDFMLEGSRRAQERNDYWRSVRELPPLPGGAGEVTGHDPS